MDLHYKTRGMTEPRGKPRVYFACRQEDFETVFQPVSDDILRFANCSVWYADNQEEQADAGELSACLDEMQLVVLAVTSEMIHTPNRARDVILPYAYEHHIPILPIMMEPGLAREFNQATKIPIQVVNRIVNDPTATPYEDVLQTYLKSVLIGDELAEKVRDAFDAYVFLSYRKKDRRHAQRLMRLIHENPQFRDIAIRINNIHQSSHVTEGAFIGVYHSGDGPGLFLCLSLFALTDHFLRVAFKSDLV